MTRRDQSRDSQVLLARHIESASLTASRLGAGRESNLHRFHGGFTEPGRDSLDAANAPLAIAGASAAIDHFSAALVPSELEREAATIARLMVSDDYREGLAAFAGRRPPTFVGR